MTRNKAAIAFMELYNVLKWIHHFSLNIYDKACMSENESDPIGIYQELRVQSFEIDEYSSRLIKCAKDLGDIIEIYDEQLWKDLQWLVAWKGAFVHNFPDMMKIEYADHQIKTITLQFPNEELTENILYKITNGREFPDWPTFMANTEIREVLKNGQVADDN